MPVTSFAELTKQMHLLNDFILEDMVYAKDEHEEELLIFSKHLFGIKNWFTRISATNKKRFLLALLEDVTSAWTVAVVLLCIWNCQTKDAIMSTSGATTWSSYDQVPLDHNRTAMPLQTLAEVMKSDRKWFLSLEPDSQAVVICELLAVTSGPIILSVLHRAQTIYERYREDQLRNIEMSIMIEDLPHPKPYIPPAPQKVENKSKSQNKAFDGVDASGAYPQTLAQRNLYEHLAYWESAVNSMKDSLNLKEEEVTFKDGTKRNIWKVKRVRPEDIETADFIQLLPSNVGKMILSYLPRTNLGDYARVNKYWAYLVDDYKAELATRAKIDMDLEKLQNLVIRNEPSMEMFEVPELKDSTTTDYYSSKVKQPPLQSWKSSAKSVAGAFTFKRFLTERMMKPDVPPVRVPIRNMADMTERLDSRGAVDEGVWRWCAAILKRRRCTKHAGTVGDNGGVLLLGNMHFPCPLLAKSLKLPLCPPLISDHTKGSGTSCQRNISSVTLRFPRDHGERRLHLWSRNVSRLYLAYKVPSYSKIAKDKREEELIAFSRHLYAMKNWFCRISAPNKKRFLLVLLEDVTSAWTVAVILLCIWNCQTKDAVMSRCGPVPWSSYDQVPMDHNRTAMPPQTLAQVMKADRKWFLSLEPDSQSSVICELLSVTGGPIIAEVMRRAQLIYERYRKLQLKNIEMSIMVTDQPEKPLLPRLSATQKMESQPKQQANGKQSTLGIKIEQSTARKNLNDHLGRWENTIKSMKDSLNLKEEEFTFKDGTKQNIWKVKRAKPEDIETVDFLQLLPSAIGKRILSFLSRPILADCARVNKYWAYLVEELKAELTARVKLQTDMEKLLELVHLHDPVENFETLDLKNKDPSVQATSICMSTKLQSQVPLAVKNSVNSTAGTAAYSFRRFLSDRINRHDVPALQNPIRNMADMAERVERRGAIDANLWGWCATTLRRRTCAKRYANAGKNRETARGVLVLGNVHFPCPLLSQMLKLPLYPPLVVDHTARSTVRPSRNMSNAAVTSICKEHSGDRFCLWTRNLSRLYLASKVPSYSKIGK